MDFVLTVFYYAVPVLRSKECTGALATSMVSAAKKSYSRQFGFPAVKAGKLAAATAVVQKSEESKGDGWIYRWSCSIPLIFHYP